VAISQRLVAVVWASSIILGLGTARAQNTSSNASSGPGISRGPSLEDALYLYRMGRVDAAIREYTQLENGPQAALAYARVTHVFLLKGHTDDAYDAAAKAKELAPAAADTRVALGEVYFRQGKLGEAEAEFVAVINSGANNAWSYLGLARTSRVISYHAREKRLIDKAHELDPTDPDITPEWMDTLPRTERAKALQEYLAQGANSDPDSRKWLETEIKLRQKDPFFDSHPCRRVSNTKPGEVDLQPFLDEKVLEGFGLDVTVNGVTSRLLLDTGADNILITRKTAEKAHVTKIFDTMIAGFGDKKPARGYVGHADILQIGDMEFHDCNVEVVEKGPMSDQGLIGPDAFSDFLVDIDMPNRKFRLSALPARPGETARTPALGYDPDAAEEFHDRYIAPEMKGYTPVFRFGHMLLIPTRVNDLAPRLFVIDSGAVTSIITPGTAREVTRVSDENDVEFGGLSGRVNKLYLGGELTLTFAGLRQTNLDILSFDEKNISDSVGTEISGTLGFPLLMLLDMKIDYRDGLVSFTFAPLKSDAKRN
jgi:tetratricopeptide (TPR) repeat protein